jgi:hypothetical protein
MSNETNTISNWWPPNSKIYQFWQFLLENLNYKDFQVFKPIIGMN